MTLSIARERYDFQSQASNENPQREIPREQPPLLPFYPFEALRCKG